MITNLLATIVVTLTTNTTERFPMHTVYGACPGVPVQYAVACSQEVPDANPTNKWMRTTVARNDAVAFDYNGQRYTNQIGSVVISETEVEYVLRQEWEPKEGPLIFYGDQWRTNAMVFWTNGPIVTIATNRWNTLLITNTAPDQPKQTP